MVPFYPEAGADYFSAGLEAAALVANDLVTPLLSTLLIILFYYIFVF